MSLVNRVPSVVLILLALSFLTCKREPPVAPPSKDTTFVSTARILANGQEPAVSPDGSKLAFTYQGNICVMDTGVRATETWDGTKTRYDTVGGSIIQLTSSGRDFLPRWNPSGQSIGFVRSDPVTSNLGVIYSVGLPGGTVTKMTFSQFVEDSNTQERWDWSPDGKYIAFFSYNTAARRESLNVVLTSTGSRVYAVQTYYDFAPSDGTGGFAWSLTPDEIAYSRQDPDSIGPGQLWLVNLISRKATQDIFFTLRITDLCRAPLENKFAHNYYPIQSPMIVVTDFSHIQGQYSVSAGGGLKWSFDEKYFIYDWPYFYLGPGPYSQERIALYSVPSGKQYVLVPDGDFNKTNLFFEWGRAPNTVYCEIGGHIYVVAFREPE